jgi:hypothetical protein
MQRIEEDATEDLLVIVTKKDAENGIPGDEFHCMIAVSLLQKGYTDVLIGRTRAYLSSVENGKATRTRYVVPQVTRQAELDYDIYGVLPENGELWLYAVPPSSQKGSRTSKIMKKRPHVTKAREAKKFSTNKKLLDEGVRHRIVPSSVS